MANLVASSQKPCHEEKKQNYQDQGTQGSEQIKPEPGVLRIGVERYLSLVKDGSYVVLLGVGEFEFLGASVFPFEEAGDGLVLVLDQEPLVVGLVVRDGEGLIFDRSLELLGIELPDIRGAP